MSNWGAIVIYLRYPISDNVAEMRLKALAIAAIIILIAAFSYLHYQPSQPLVLRVSTTTSLYATGLLDMLADEFRRERPNVFVQFLAVGSGEALRIASQGDVDLVLVHAPPLEQRYIELGVIADGRIFAYNYFVLVGPADDPAGARGLDVKDAFRAIFKAGRGGKAVFVSRGDNSGTHVRELEIWGKVGLDPHGEPWYIETGSGMSQTLMVAAERGAYTLSDIGTYLRFSGRLKGLDIISDKGEELLNIYSAYIVPGSKNAEVAEEFIEFLVSERGQALIGSYGVEEYGRPLFYPASSAPAGWLRDNWLKMAGGGP